MLLVGPTSSGPDLVYIPLKKIGLATYIRECNPRILQLSMMKDSEIVSETRHKFLVAADSRDSDGYAVGIDKRFTKPKEYIHIPYSARVLFQVTSAIPQAAYGHSRRTFYSPADNAVQFFACSFVVALGTKRMIIGVLVDRSRRVMLVDTTTPEGDMFFFVLRRTPEEPMEWGGCKPSG
jgi:hypothetical protein